MIPISKDSYKNKIKKEYFEAGINTVDTAPGDIAVKNADIFEINTIEAKDKLIEKLSKVSQSEWEKATIKGLPDLKRKVTRAIDTGKWNASEVLAAAREAHNAAIKIKKDKKDLHTSYERFKAAQDAIKKHYKK